MNCYFKISSRDGLDYIEVAQEESRVIVAARKAVAVALKVIDFIVFGK